MRKTSLRSSLVCGVAVVSMSVFSSANALDCSGKISHVLMYSSGVVMIVGSWRGDYTVICSTDGSWGGIASETCLAWYGTALKARADNTTVDVYYASPGSSTCATLPTYGGALVPGYLLVISG